MKSGTEAATNSSAGVEASRSAAVIPRRPGARTALAISNPAVEHRVIASSSGIACGRSQAQKIGPCGVARENPRERAERDSVVQNEDDGRDSRENAGREREKSDPSVVNEQACRKDRLEAERDWRPREELLAIGSGTDQPLEIVGRIHRRRDGGINVRRILRDDGRAGQCAGEQDNCHQPLQPPGCRERRGEAREIKSPDLRLPPRRRHLQMRISAHAQRVEIAHRLRIAAARAQHCELRRGEPIKMCELANLLEGEPPARALRRIEEHFQPRADLTIRGVHQFLPKILR